ncbi:MAG TPA: hypothetical protein PKO06_22585 [Candidatus Ozemobacteraceae bacterium]|nr:hypothetical protein [Candidatus Ozemobacteraceae bacterium]
MNKVMHQFESRLSKQELKSLSGLTTPFRIQEYLDQVGYSDDEFYRCPLRVMRDRKAHCFDGAVFAAMALRRLGLPPLLIELLPNDRDDDHLLALFKIDGCWGAIGKSNFSGLRYREPIHRTLRELVLSYFEPYYNVAYEKTLRGYTVPMNLSRFDRSDWMANDEPLYQIADALDTMRRYSLLTKAMEKRLNPVDERSYQAGLMGSLASGLYNPLKQS